jgi:hypothetical protein
LTHPSGFYLLTGAGAPQSETPAPQTRSTKYKEKDDEKVLALMVVLAGTGSVRAEEISCTGTLGAVTVDNLRVPDGRTCTLNRTRVQGTIYVGTNSTLKATRIHVIGNIQAEGAKLVTVTTNSFVGGSIQIKQGGAATIDRVRVTHDILFDDNERAMKATRNTVGGNIQAFQNTGGLNIANNVVDGNLQCKENTPRPTGGGNVVHGSKEDQCANL